MVKLVDVVLMVLTAVVLLALLCFGCFVGLGNLVFDLASLGSRSGVVGCSAYGEVGFMSVFADGLIGYGIAIGVVGALYITCYVLLCCVCLSACRVTWWLLWMMFSVLNGCCHLLFFTGWVVVHPYYLCYGLCGLSWTLRLL